MRRICPGTSIQRVCPGITDDLTKELGVMVKPLVEARVFLHMDRRDEVERSSGTGATTSQVKKKWTGHRWVCGGSNAHSLLLIPGYR